MWIFDYSQEPSIRSSEDAVDPFLFHGFSTWQTGWTPDPTRSLEASSNDVRNDRICILDEETWSPEILGLILVSQTFHIVVSHRSLSRR